MSKSTRNLSYSLQFKYRGSRLTPIIKFSDEELLIGHSGNNGNPTGSTIHDRMFTDLISLYNKTNIIEFDLCNVETFCLATKGECQTVVNAFADFLLEQRKYSLLGQYPGATNEDHYKKCAIRFKNMTQNEKNLMVLLAIYMDNSRMIYTYSMLYADLIKGEDSTTISNRVGIERKKGF